VTRRLELRVEASRCTRCGACSALCPSVFDVSAGACRIARQPAAGEQLFAEAAKWVCPTDAIRAGAADADGADDSEISLVEPSPEEDVPLFDGLAAGAEAVRWALAGLPWKEFDPTLAAPDLRVVVREMAFSENATYSATQRFLDAFCDDVDFSRWVSIWFYEENRHPYVLMEWLRRAGEHLPPDFILKGRVSTPLMRSNFGTLVTNVVSEVTASQAYRHLARTSPEPVLARIAALIAGDEARHAASFFRFARRQVASAPKHALLRERARGLEVLHAWLGSRQVTHPVQQMVDRLGGGRAGSSSIDLDFGAIRLRVVRVIGLLLDVPLRRVDDVAPALRELLTTGRD
jgi:ferredoxin